ncbi:hypothetical protein K432DRAFT_378543 [Lepidopterella palustris CBS 459.81]|uniref:Uncharacterized protein n=1 Tax=Lepidopterella palustris CBS 459.81 TaxID=1314670 RepID=A0A8E2EIA2_9PEZI|nr:hypothetical protein K432DRAFT_378543 [Lepidopterella palustris CBS 459.81]
MAAPPTTQSQALQSMSQSSMKAVPQSPVSPDAQIRDQGRDRERVAVLLDINSELLQEIVSLQAQGKAGHIGQMPPPKEEGKPEPDLKPASKEYVDCMRRLQANLSYLATTAERAHKPSQVIPPGPAIMSVPSSYPALSDLYTKLQALFPGWRGQQLKASPGPQRPNMQQMQQNPQAQPSQG